MYILAFMGWGMALNYRDRWLYERRHAARVERVMGIAIQEGSDYGAMPKTLLALNEVSAELENE